MTMGLPFLLAVMSAASPGKAAPRRASDGSPVVLKNRDAGRLLVRQVIPDYPPLAKINYIQGPVDLKVVVTPSGNVSSVHVLRGEALLAAAALQAVRQWHYRPYVGRHGPESFETLVKVKFALRIWKIRRLPMHPAKDLARQVHPPRVVGPSGANPAKRLVRMRVLVGDNGDVLDAEPVGARRDDVAAARSTLNGWKFQPAYWGTLPIPWYLNVNVPVPGAAAHPDPSLQANR